MASVYNEDLAFIHVPKTGGKWVNKALECVGDGYEEVGDHAWWDAMPEGRFTFGFVRHPATWYASYYAYVKAADWDFEVTPLDQAVLDSESFEEFVRSVCEANPEGLVTRLYNDFLGPPGAVDFVGHYESLRDDLLRALEMSGASKRWDQPYWWRGGVCRALVKSLRATNESREKPEITPEVLRIVEVCEPEALTRFGY